MNCKCGKLGRISIGGENLCWECYDKKQTPAKTELQESMAEIMRDLIESWLPSPCKLCDSALIYCLVCSRVHCEAQHNMEV